MQTAGERPVYIWQLHGKGTISNLHKHFIQSCTVRGKSLPVGQVSWWRDNKPSNYTSMHSYSEHCVNTFCVSSYKAYWTPFSNVKCWSYSTVRWLYGETYDEAWGSWHQQPTKLHHLIQVTKWIDQPVVL